MVSLFAPSLSLHQCLTVYKFSNYFEDDTFSKAFSEGCTVFFGLDFMFSSGGSFTTIDVLGDFGTGSSGIKCSRLRRISF